MINNDEHYYALMDIVNIVKDSSHEEIKEKVGRIISERNIQLEE